MTEVFKVWKKNESDWTSSSDMTALNGQLLRNEIQVDKLRYEGDRGSIEVSLSDGIIKVNDSAVDIEIDSNLLNNLISVGLRFVQFKKLHSISYGMDAGHSANSYSVKLGWQVTYNNDNYHRIIELLPDGNYHLDKKR